MDRPKYFVSSPGKLDEYRVRRHFPALQRFGQGSGRGKNPTEASLELMRDKKKKLKEIRLKKPRPGTLRFQRIQRDRHANEFRPFVAAQTKKRMQTAEMRIDRNHWAQEDFNVLSEVRTRIIMQPSKSRNLPPADVRKAEERATRRPWAGSNRVAAEEAISRRNMLAPREPYRTKRDREREQRQANRERWLNPRGFLSSGAFTKRSGPPSLHSVDGNAELTAELQFYRMKSMELRQTKSGRAAAKASRRRAKEAERAQRKRERKLAKAAAAAQRRQDAGVEDDDDDDDDERAHREYEAAAAAAAAAEAVLRNITVHALEKAVFHPLLVQRTVQVQPVQVRLQQVVVPGKTMMHHYDRVSA